MRKLALFGIVAGLFLAGCSDDDGGNGNNNINNQNNNNNNNQQDCGNGVVDGSEECDGTELNGETCTGLGYDDGTLACAGDCTFDDSGCTAQCGNGAIAPSEVCDDGNTDPGDGCGADCTVENGWYCTGQPSTCTTQCGDGIPAGTEVCDDGDLRSHDGCSSGCTDETLMWYEVTTSATPIDRFGYGLAYDSGRGVTVLFGGWDNNSNRSDTWEFGLDDWTLATPVDVPTAVRYPKMVYDPDRGVIVMFGGFDDVIGIDETWEYDGTTWSLVTTIDATPPGRYHHGMAYDTNRDVIVMFGGADAGNVCHDDTWEFDGTNWSHVTTVDATPPRFFGFAMDYDPVDDRTVLFGGWDCDQTAGNPTTWEYNGVTWAETADGTPTHRRYVGMAYHSFLGALVLHGGYTGGSSCLGETWTYDGSTWTETTDATPVSLRRYHELAYDNHRRRIVTVSGSICGGWAPFTAIYQYTSNWPDEICDNTTDDDTDGLADCEDPDCDGLPCNGGFCSGGACQ